MRRSIGIKKQLNTKKNINKALVKIIGLNKYFKSCSVIFYDFIQGKPHINPGTILANI